MHFVFMPSNGAQIPGIRSSGQLHFYGGTKYLWVLRNNLLHVILQASRSLRWLQGIWKICDPVH